MAFNLFEGGRRITQVIMAATVICGVIIAWKDEPPLIYRYSVNFGGLPPIQTSDECSYPDMTESANRETPSGHPVRVDYCFKAHRAENGEMMIPYKPAENGAWWMKSQWSDDVEAYAKKIVSTFQLSDEQRQHADWDWWMNRLKNGGKTIVWAFFAALCIHFSASLVGWIMRGFLGIPNGRDAKA